MREEEKKRFSKKSGFKRFLSKRWALPAIYLASAAILIIAVLWFQNSNEDTADSGDIKVQEHGNSGSNEESIEVGSKMENVMLPVDDADSVVVKTDFYDKNGSKESQEKALIFYNNKYHMNRGIDLAMEDGKTFEVVASLSGKVTKVEDDALLGNTIVIEHQNGITTHYQSVTDIAVEVGDEVVKGQVIAKAGKSTLNEEAGTHVHFEIRKDGTAVNPNTYIGKSVATIVEAEAKSEAEVKKDESKSNDKPAEEQDVEEEDLNSEHSTEEDSADDQTEQE
ncbi:M23 family metallopeptidase [Bacillus sp. AGMB 02131]|uniref:M23 family metallopeptidase n=1 Tax=Peribacillus faecalis TaxID=2772559 RepID=A0A927D042_9BACI|nr:M23 family metallopeptidase [Peribacillus faecalis]MBD3110201.1 M23 family metallopeptidase [Peribacillus faecalis]